MLAFEELRLRSNFSLIESHFSNLRSISEQSGNNANHNAAHGLHKFHVLLTPIYYNTFYT